jgi:hypothetical protein
VRRVLAIIGAVALLLSLPGGAAATKPYREVDHTRDTGCSAVPTPLGFADFDGFESALYGVDAWIDVWSGDPYESDLVLTRDWDQPADVIFGSGTVSMSIPVVPSGVVTIAGTFAAANALGWDDSFRDGNSWYRSSATGTELSFSGTMTLPGVATPVAFGPEGCGGSDLEQSTFVTQPHARVAKYTSTGGSCEVANADGDTGFVFLFADGTSIEIDGNIVDSGGAEVGFFGIADVAPDGTATIDVQEYDPQTGELTGDVGSASVSAVDTGDAFAYTLKTSNGFDRTHGTVVDIEGSLTTSLGSFSLDTCIAANTETKIVTTPSNGPKPGGKRPANDLPSEAVALTPGARATVATKGAQAPREADYPCLQFEDGGDGSVLEIPVAYTVWYRVAGTGGNVTVDTAGSDFDTVVAVYAGAADAGSTVACVDDVPLDPFGRTLQAAATFPTTVGTTYWIQIGGLDEATFFGDTRFKPYGTLKVAVR